MVSLSMLLYEYMNNKFVIYLSLVATVAVALLGFDTFIKIRSLNLSVATSKVNCYAVTKEFNQDSKTCTEIFDKYQISF